MAPVPLPKRISSDQATNDRRRTYQTNRQYYRGQQRITTLRRRSTARNYTQLFIDTIAAQMGEARASWGDNAAANALDAYVADVLRDNDAELADYDQEVGCAIDGDAATKVTWDDQERRVRLSVLDPATLYVSTRPDDPTAVEMIAQQYDLAASDAPIMFGGALVTGFGNRAKATITEEWTRDYWRVWLQDEPMLTEPNPYGGLIPYIVWPNLRIPGQFWGTGDGERIRGDQDRLNEAADDLDRNMRLASQIVVVENADGGGDLTVRPGAIWDLPADSRAYILDFLSSNAVGQRLWHIGDIRETLFALARVPTIAVQGSDKALSGVALQLELGPLIRQVAQKRLYRTVALRERAMLIAALGSQFDGLPGAASHPEIIWSDAIPSDRQAALQNARAELALGRDPAAVLRSIGVEDPDAELDAALRRNELLAALAAPAPTPGA